MPPRVGNAPRRCFMSGRRTAARVLEFGSQSRGEQVRIEDSAARQTETGVVRSKPLDRARHDASAVSDGSQGGPNGENHDVAPDAFPASRGQGPGGGARVHRPVRRPRVVARAPFLVLGLRRRGRGSGHLPECLAQRWQVRSGRRLRGHIRRDDRAAPADRQEPRPRSPRRPRSAKKRARRPRPLRGSAPNSRRCSACPSTADFRTSRYRRPPGCRWGPSRRTSAGV